MPALAVKLVALSIPIVTGVADIVQSESLHAVIGIADQVHGSISPSIGRVVKHSMPLLVQDKPWEPRLDNGYPNVIAPSNNTPWQLWYGDCIHVNSCGTQVLLYANSTDGLSWEKPELGLFDLGQIRPDLGSIGTANNIVLQGGGIGIYRDEHTTDSARRYVAFGPGCYMKNCSASGMENRPASGDLAFSADGFTWHDERTLNWPKPQRYDCHNNLFFDTDSGRYVATTRDYLDKAGRAIAIATAEELPLDTSEVPHLSLTGTLEHQLYSQITFPWRGVYLGIVMVYDAQDPEECVHCRLAWAPSPTGHWKWIDSGGLAGLDFIPLGTKGTFDSHICFAAKPVRHGDEERLYYMGGDGPHFKQRTSSLGLATLRADGYVSMSGTGTLITRKLLVTGRQLIATADFAGGGSLQIGLADTGPETPSGLLLNRSVPLTANATNAAMRFQGGCSGPDFYFLLGKEVTLEVKLEQAILYTIGFAPAHDIEDCVVI